MARGRPFIAVHGGWGTPEYRCWQEIKARCLNKSKPYWKDYGGRGIRMCDAWVNSFATFLRDMGPRPTPRHSIDRLENDGNYSPDNCRWATKKEQSRNRRVTKLNEEKAAQIRARYAAGGVTKSALAREYDVAFMTIQYVISGVTWAPDLDRGCA